MKLFLSFLVSIFIFSSCQKKSDDQPYELTSVGALFEDQAATRLIQAERYEDALGVYVDMLEREPQKPQIHSNVGVIMAQIQKEEDALKSWQYALKLAADNKDLATLFAVNFNLGVYYGAKKNVDEALKYYQAALDIVPTSIETKTNIELLTQAQQQDGKGDSQNQDQNQKDQNQSKDSKDQQNKDQQKDQDGKDNQKKDPKDQDGQEDKKRENSAKYKPRPFKGDQLNENDVKKILGELRNQEQKIRANFDKKEQKDSGHEKDW